MNFLMSPMLVIAYSLIGNINFDITRESLGKDKNKMMFSYQIYGHHQMI
ncbi:MAG: hypothetical protein Ct9H90mP18_01100 [Gammaproteobacteria bacterium]|nr:MAG: hypothetical protein Ct9H90mP18_01100 [Gammaproteobacteria bacterium]